MTKNKKYLYRIIFRAVPLAHKWNEKIKEAKTVEEAKRILRHIRRIYVIQCDAFSLIHKK